MPEELAYFDHAALYWYLTPSGRPAAGGRWGGAAAAAIGTAIGAAAGTGPALVLHPDTSCLASHAALAASSAVGRATAAGRGGGTATAAGRAASKSTGIGAATGAAIDRTAGKGDPPRLGANSPLPAELAYFDHAALYWYLAPSGRPAAGVRWGGAAAAAIGAAAIGAAAGTGPALVLHPDTSCLASHAALAASAPGGGTTAATAGRAAVTGARTIDCFGRMAAALSPIEGVRLGERPAVKLRRKSMMTHWLKQSRLKGVRSFKMMRDFGGAKRRKTRSEFLLSPLRVG